MVGPALVRALFRLGHGVDEAVDHLAVIVAVLGADQRRGRHIVVARDHDRRPVQQRGGMECQRRLAGTRRTTEVDGKPGFQIGKRSLGNRFDGLRLHKVSTPLGHQRSYDSYVL